MQFCGARTWPGNSVLALAAAVDLSLLCCTTVYHIRFLRCLAPTLLLTMFSTARPVNQAKMVSAVAPKARAVRPSVSAHFQVTFITPSGEKIVEIAANDYIIEVANVRRSPTCLVCDSITKTQTKLVYCREFSSTGYVLLPALLAWTPFLVLTPAFGDYGFPNVCAPGDKRLVSQISPWV